MGERFLREEHINWLYCTEYSRFLAALTGYIKLDVREAGGRGDAKKRVRRRNKRTREGIGKGVPQIKEEIIAERS